MINLIDSYLDTTTVHGFKYVQRTNHWILRLIWVSLYIDVCLQLDAHIAEYFIKKKKNICQFDS